MKNHPFKWYALGLGYFLGLCANVYIWQSIFLLCLICLVSKIKDISFYCFVILCFILGFLYGEKKEVPNLPNWFVENQKEEYSAFVEKAQSLPDKRWRLIVSDIKKKGENESLEGDGVIYLYYDKAENDDAPIEGMRIHFNEKITIINFGENKEILASHQYWFDKNIFYSGYVTMNKPNLTWSGEGSFLSRVRENIYKKFVDICRDEKGEISQAHAFAIALIFGERFYFDTRTVNLFTSASLVHSIALSGMHLAFAVMCAYVLGKVFVYIYPNILYKFPFKFLVTSISMPLALLYFWIGNTPISLMRAGIMLFIIWLAMLKYKKFSLLDILMLAATLILIFIPSAWRDLGFQLSVLSVASIAFINPYLTEYYNKFLNYKDSKIKSFCKKIIFSIFSLLSISFGIQVFLYPLQSYTFGLISPYFFMNALWLPLLQLVVMPLNFLALFSMPFVESSKFFLDQSTYIIQKFTTFLFYLDENSLLDMLQAYRFDLWQGIGYLLCLLTFLYRKVLPLKKSILFLSFALLLSPVLINFIDNSIAKLEDRLVIRMINVGQGQSILLEYNGKRSLIDAGGVYGYRFDTGRDTIAKILTYQNNKNLDYAIVTHFDLDHAKGFFHIVEHFDIENFLYSPKSTEKDLAKYLLEEVSKNKISKLEVKVHDKIHLADYLYLEVLSPTNKKISAEDTEELSSNNLSIVLRVVYKGRGVALLCGDIEKEGIDYILADNTDISADILVLPHHASQDAYNEKFYERVNPQHALISSGRYNRYKFPHDKVTEYFLRRNIPILNTATTKDITFIFNKFNMLNQRYLEK